MKNISIKQLTHIIKTNSNIIASIINNDSKLKDSIFNKFNVIEQNQAAKTIQYNWKYKQYLPIINSITKCAHTVYNNLSWGYQESIYREALVYELRENNIKCQVELPLTIQYKNSPLSYGASRIDILVNNMIVIELKADSLSNATINKATQQCKRYLKQGNYPIGMIIGFPDKENRTIISNIITI